MAPHPDDETLGVGGTMKLLHDAGWRVEIIAVTAGEASHPHSQAVPAAELRERRRSERAQALARLGLASVGVRELALPDGRVAAHETELRRSLVAALAGARYGFVTWRHDGHPDHEAVGRATAQAAARCTVTLVEYPIWTWHWARPNDARVPWHRARRVDLPPALRQAGACPYRVRHAGPSRWADAC